MQPVDATGAREARDRVCAALDQDASQSARAQLGKDGAGIKAAFGLDPHHFDTGGQRARGMRAADDQPPRAVIGQKPRLRRQTTLRIDHDARRIRTADPPHRQLRIVRDRGADADHDGVDQRPQPMQMVEAFAAVDVFGMSARRRDPAVERLTDLRDDHHVVGRALAQRPEQSSPWRRQSIIAAAELRHEGCPAIPALVDLGYVHPVFAAALEALPTTNARTAILFRQAINNK